MKILLPSLCLLVSIGSQAQTVDAVLARMDRSAPNFHAMSADIKMSTHTAIIDDTTVETGTFRMQRVKSGDVRAVIDFTGPTDPRQIGFFGRIVRIYYPKMNSYQDYDIGKNTNALNQFLLLGFGSSGKDLAENYTITAEGQENVSGIDTTRLQLVPKTADVQKHLTKVEIWVPNNAANPVQQQFFDPSGNYRIVTYSNINLKPSLPGKLELKLPSGAKKQSS